MGTTFTKVMRTMRFKHQRRTHLKTSRWKQICIPVQVNPLQSKSLQGPPYSDRCTLPSQYSTTKSTGQIQAAFVFGPDNIQIAYPSNNDDCEEWRSESQTFTEVNGVCMAEMLVSDYNIQFNGDDTYEMCYADLSESESCYIIQVFSDGIVMRNLYVAEGQEDVCRILLNSIEPSTANSQSMHLYSKVIINDRIRYDVEDSWTTQFLLESRDLYNEAKSSECFYEQFEYTGPRVMFDVVDDAAALTEAVNDSLTLVTVSQAEYTVPYQDTDLGVCRNQGI